MNDYFIKCPLARVPRLMELAVMLGLLQPNPDNPGEYVPKLAGVAWVVIGEIHKPTGREVPAAWGGTMPEVSPVLASDGLPAWHANLRVPFDSLLAYAQERYAEAPSPALAEALQDFAPYFLLTPTGEQAQPKNPAVVFA